MPLYEYRCAACGEQFEVIRRFSDPALDTCVRCGGGPVERLLSSPAIQFKGSGWYITDYARKGKGDGAGASEAGAAKDAKGAKDTSSAPSSGEAPAKSEAPAKKDTASAASTPAKPAAGNG